MRSGAASISLADPWLASAMLIGLAPSAADAGDGDAQTLPFLTVGAMVLATLLLGFVRRRLAGVLEAWRREPSGASRKSSASRTGD